MLIKCADIANPTREWEICEKWARRIVEEYFDQVFLYLINLISFLSIYQLIS